MAAQVKDIVKPLDSADAINVACTVPPDPAGGADAVMKEMYVLPAPFNATYLYAPNVSAEYGEANATVGVVPIPCATDKAPMAVAAADVALDPMAIAVSSIFPPLRR